MSEFEDRFPIRVVARRTGLSVHAIRVWERRYKAVVPIRGTTNRRMYSNADIERLRLLRRATQLGHSIGHIANKDEQDLIALIAQDAPKTAATGRPQVPAERRPEVAPEYLVELCIAAAEQCDDAGLAQALDQSRACLAESRVLDTFIVPLLERMNGLRNGGLLGLANLQMTFVLVEAYLTQLRLACPVSQDAPFLVVVAPSGHCHDLGAPIVAAIGAQAGWRVTCIGANLPAEEIARLAAHHRARAVALGTCSGAALAGMPEEIERLRSSLDPAIPLLVAARAMEHGTASGIVILSDVSAVREELARLARRRA